MNDKPNSITANRQAQELIVIWVDAIPADIRLNYYGRGVRVPNAAAVTIRWDPYHLRRCSICTLKMSRRSP